MEEKNNKAANGLLSIIITGIVMYGCYWYFNSSGNVFSTDRTTNTSISINKQYIKGSIEYVVEATGTNNGTKPIEFISTDFTCYDKNGSVVGTADDYMSSKVGVNQTWNIKATYFGSDANTIAECKLSKVEAKNAD